MPTKKRKKAILALEDGRTFEGLSFGAAGEACGEVVFNTSMSGYQEILTDPSYKGQIVTMTYPLIGNYGVNTEDVESRKIFLEAFIVKELSSVSSNWRSVKTLDDYLKENNIPGIEGVDTRALTKHIRLEGAMKAVLSAKTLNKKKLIEKAKNSPGLIGKNLVKDVVTDKAYDWNKNGKHKVIVIDCGVKFNILKNLEKRNCSVKVVPYSENAKKILSEEPDGVLISNGPGDPAAVGPAIKTAKELIGKVPIFGICLGQQILGLALGGKTYKLKFGHHGANQPVKDIRTGRVYITSQNHGFSVDLRSLDKDKVEATHINLNDNTVEGIKHKEVPVFSVQFHPEAGPGPNDATYLFDEFLEMMRGS